MTTTTGERTLFWHWPDHCIGKRESRRLREEHNAEVLVKHQLLAALEGLMKEFVGDRNAQNCLGESGIAADKARAAVAAAKGGAS